MPRIESGFAGITVLSPAALTGKSSALTFDRRPMGGWHSSHRINGVSVFVGRIMPSSISLAKKFLSKNMVSTYVALRWFLPSVLRTGAC